MLVRKLWNLIFQVQGENSALNRARYEALSKQIPLMYGIVMIDIISLSYTHFPFAPIYLTVLFPAILLPMTIIRSIKIIYSDLSLLSNEDVRRRLVTINYLAVIIGAVSVVWSMALFPYGDAIAQSHIAFFMGLTAIGVITCLMHVHQASVIIAAVVVVPTVIFFNTLHEQVYQALSVNIFLVVGVILYIMFRYSEDFTKLINNQQKLERQSGVLKILNSENMRLANLDSLTMLPNRRCFFNKLNSILNERRSSRDPFVVGMLDLDGFKQINDLFGHPVGDQLLIDTGERLRALLDKEIFIARLGGDEFGLIISEPGTEEELLELGKVICRSLKQPFDLNGGTAKVAGTLGFAFYPSAGVSASVLFERADYALCYSKQNSKGNVVMFSEEHETIIREVSAMSHRLREADLDDELRVVFQPIIDCKTGDVKCFEALARWTNPILGNIAPNIFIRSAEQSGMISQLTHILFSKTLEAVSHWREDVDVSFNLSTFDLCSKEATFKLIAMIEKSGIDPKRITFEITESAVMQDFDRALEGVNLLRQMGCKIGLDDFGTGFSSLSYIHRMPIDRLKIDRSFIIDIESNETTLNIVRTIGDLCRNLDLECIVEGVETKQQLDILSAMDLDIIQGYYFSKPLSEEDALAYMADREIDKLPMAASA